MDYTFGSLFRTLNVFIFVIKNHNYCLPDFRSLLLEEPDDDNVTHHHCQESCTVDAEDGDEELDWKFGDAEHHRRLVRRADHGGHGASNEE